MKNLILIFTVLITFSNIRAQTYVKPIRTINPNSTNFEDLTFLKETLKDVRILGLGEQSHMDGATNDARVRLIKYLHEELGYNVIMFESGMYNCSIANDLISKRKQGDETNYLFKAIFGLWHTEEINKLAKYIDETYLTENPLILTGMDIQFSGDFSRKQYIGDFKSVIDYVEKKSNEKLRIDTTKLNFSLNQLRRYSNYPKKISPEDTLVISTAFNKICNTIESAKLNNDSIAYWKQWMFSMKMDYRKRYVNNTSFRDSMMAVNATWLAKNKYKGEKIIIWAANSHLRKNTDSIDDERFNSTRTGEFIKREFKYKYYFMGFTAFEGKRRIIFKSKIPKPNKVGIERFLYNKGYDYSFLDLRTYNDRDNKYFNNSALFGYYELDMDVFKMMDGIFYIREMYPVKKI